MPAYSPGLTTLIQKPNFEHDIEPVSSITFPNPFPENYILTPSWYLVQNL